MPDRQNREQLHAKIIAHAWKNPSFKEKLLKNPRAAFKEMGLDIPEEVQIKVIEDKPNSFTFVLPPSVAHAEEMSTQELEKIAAGYGMGGCSSTACTSGTGCQVCPATHD